MEGDTVRGFIDYRLWDINPKIVDFTPNTEGSSTSYSALQITGFGVLDEYYLGAIVDTEISSRDEQSLDIFSALTLEADTVFIQTLIGGDKSLYITKTSRGIDNFYIEVDSKLVLLVYKKFLVQSATQGSNPT